MLNRSRENSVKGDIYEDGSETNSTNMRLRLKKPRAHQKNYRTTEDQEDSEESESSVTTSETSQEESEEGEIQTKSMKYHDSPRPSPPPPPQFPPRNYSYMQEPPPTSFISQPSDIEKRKRELLYKLERIRKRMGPDAILPMKPTLRDSLEDIENLIERVERDKAIDNTVQLEKQILMNFTSGVEYLNTRFDPFGIYLDGWSESISSSMTEGQFEDELYDLAEKYQGVGNGLPPEARLMIALVGSAVTFHTIGSLNKRRETVVSSSKDEQNKHSSSILDKLVRMGMGMDMGGMAGNKDKRSEPKMRGPPVDVIDEIESVIDEAVNDVSEEKENTGLKVAKSVVSVDDDEVSRLLGL